MKKTFILLMLSVSLAGMAQTQKDIINPNVPLVFFGCDFSNIRFTKAADFTNKPEINRFYVDCNHMFQDVPPFKNGVAKRLERDILKDFSYVTTNNAALDWQKVFTDEVDYALTDDIIAKMIANLKIDQQKYKNHIGLLFCEENFCKTNEIGKITILFFTVNDLKPILIKHYSFKPKGFGFLSYWNYMNESAMYELKDIVKEIKTP
jgi:hypothetical protein